MTEPIQEQVVKPFIELTRKEFKALAKQKLTYKQLGEQYPQPEWCSYPGATEGIMGCWSLMDFRIKTEDDCKDCDLHLVRQS